MEMLDTKKQQGGRKAPPLGTGSVRKAQDSLMSRHDRLRAIEEEAVRGRK